LPSRPGDDDAASTRRRAAEVARHGRVLSRSRGEELVNFFRRRTVKRAVVVLVVMSVVIGSRVMFSAGPEAPTIDQFLMPGTPTEVVAAKKAERLAWTAYEHGLRNVYTAAAPAFTPVRLTNVTRDDGVELSDISVSDDGAIVVFVRGTQPNR